MHSKMLMDIEKVQIHFGGSVKASSQMIRELLRSQCLSCPCYRRWAAGPGPRGRRRASAHSQPTTTESLAQSGGVCVRV